MKKYKKVKLIDIIEFQRGKDLTKENMKNGKYPVVGSNGIIGYHNKFTTEKPSITIGRSGNVGRPFIYDGKSWSHNTTLYIKKFKSINPYYIYYLLKNLHLEEYGGGSTVPTLNRNDIHQQKVYIPEDLRYQNEVSNFFISIDKKINLNNKINDNLEKQMKLIYETFMIKVENKKINGSFVTAKDLVEVLTGKEDANFSIQNGKFNFFTCSNEILKCNEYKYDSSSILIAGNGDFNVKHYTGKFNAYQRTYILTPQKNYYALLYLASLYRIESFKSKSTGSIVKFITKEDIENIPIFIPENKTILNNLNQMIIFKENNLSENEILIKLRDFLLPLLMNGQATISE